MRHSRARILLATFVALAIGGGAYAFTSSNTVPSTVAGAGAASVSGFTVTNLHYNLDATTPTNVDSLTFAITPAVPNTGTGKVLVQVALTTGGPNNYSCTTDTGGTNVTCSTTSPALTAGAVTGVTVIAAQ